MDDFEYSVHISDQDWNTFFQECEECNLLPPVLAGPDDSGMSDMDEMVNHRAHQDRRVPKPQIEDSRLDSEGSPVDLYLSKYGTSSPMQVLSGSEEDLHMESVNVFFERLKSISACEDPVMQKHLGDEMTDAVERSVKKETEDAKKTAMHHDTTQIYSRTTILKNKHIQQDSCTFKNSIDKSLEADPCVQTLSNKKLVIIEEEWSLETVKERMELETDGKSDDLHIEANPNPEKATCSILANAEDVREPSQEKEAIYQLAISSNSDSKRSPEECSVTPRRKRRKKKRIGNESAQSCHGHEAQFQAKQSESDNDIYVRIREMDADTQPSEDCTSGTVSDTDNAPHSLPPGSLKDRVIETYLVHPQPLSCTSDIAVPIVACPDPENLTSPSTIGAAQNQTRIDNLFEKTDVAEETSDGQCPLEAKPTSSELAAPVKETEHQGNQCDDSTSTPTNGDNVGKYLQLNNQPNMSEVLPVSITTCITSRATEASNLEVRVNLLTMDSEDLKKENSSVLHHKDNVLNSHPNGTAFHLTALLQSGPSICSNASDAAHAQSQIGDRESLSDSHCGRSEAVNQDETSVSANIYCVTFPGLAEKMLFSESCSITTEEENLPVMIHDKVPPELRNGHALQRDSESINFESEAQSLTFQTKTDDVQMKADRSPAADIMQNAPSLEQQTEVEDQAAITNETVASRLSLHSVGDDWAKENSPSFTSKDIFVLTEGRKDINTSQAEILSPTDKDMNKELTLEEESGSSLMLATDQESQVVEDLKSENSSCLSITSDEGNGKMHDVDRAPTSLSEDHDLAKSLPVSTDESKSLEMLDLDALSPPARPVYAISSFWDEMEKLTINDILRLRLVGQSQHSSVLVQPEDNSLADVLDTTDSGYFTHFDDSKPDRSSGDMSFISDLDEELAQLQTQDATKLSEESRESPNSGDIMWGSDQDPAGRGSEMEDVFKMDSLPVQQGFRKMCKNISVQNLQALEAQPISQILRNASLHSLHTVNPVHSLEVEPEEHYVDPFDRVDASSPVTLSDEEEELDSSGITFSEIIQYLFGTDEPERCASVAEDVTASYLDGTGTSVPETYDHFFSEFEAGSFFYPLTEDTSSCKEDMVPIFSCSRSANKNVQFPEVYDYFFPDDSPVHSDEDEDRDHTTIQVVTRYDYMETKNCKAVAASDMYEHILPEKDKGWSFLRNNPLSFRKIRRTGFTEAPENSNWALTPLNKSGRSKHGEIQSISVMGIDGRPYPDPLYLSLENRLFTQLATQHKICTEMQTAVADPRVDAPLVPLKQADMCLVCIAFASWVMKSVSPEGADTWKAVLLANVSALSAIRYLRKYMRDEAAKKTPLRQIEPA